MKLVQLPSYCSLITYNHTTCLYRSIHICLKHTISTTIIQDGLTALHLASSNGRVAVIRLLIQAHAVINLQCKVKNYLALPLMYGNTSSGSSMICLCAVI